MEPHHQELPRPSGGIDHEYGPQVHILSQPWPMSLLARLCRPETVQPEVNQLVGTLYDWLLSNVASRVLRTEPVEIPTRMAAKHPQHGAYLGEAIARRQRVVVVDIARAGILPSHRVFESLHHTVDPRDLRQDHVVASRLADASGMVTGVQVDASKIGGGVDGATILVPDPMAATGSSVTAVLRHYHDHPEGPPRKVVAMHLIVTPEYLARVTRDLPEVEIYAIRLDRGLSAPDVLQTLPGRRWAEERGLDESCYIVPGAGGVGEVLNNAWI